MQKKLFESQILVEIQKFNDNFYLNNKMSVGLTEGDLDKCL